MQQTDRTIYVGSVGKEVDEAALLALFGHCGTVTQIRIAGDPSYDTRYAFIEFTTPEEAQVALLLDGMSVFDRSIKVSMARGGAGPGVVRSNDPDRVQRTIHVGGLPMEDLSESVLAEFFQHVGEVLAVRKSGRFAWVEFSTIQAAHQALQLDGEPLGTGMLKISQSKTPIHTAGWRAPAQGHSRLTMSSYMTSGMGTAPGMSMPNMGAQQMMSRTQLGSQMGAGAGTYGGNPSLAELQQLQGLSGGQSQQVVMGLQGLSLGGNPGASGRSGGVGMHGAGGGQGLGMGPGPSVLSMPNLPNIATGQQAGGGMALPGSSIPMGLAHTGMGDTQSLDQRLSPPPSRATQLLREGGMGGMGGGQRSTPRFSNSPTTPGGSAPFAIPAPASRPFSPTQLGGSAPGHGGFFA